MKKLLGISVVIVLFTCCATEIKVIPPVRSLLGIDFTPFTKKGFLITPEKYLGTYESIGIIDYMARQGAIFQYVGKKSITSEYLESDRYVDSYEWVKDTLSLYNVMNDVFKICTEMGANALVNFKNEISSNSIGSLADPVDLITYHITGYAIRRTDN